MELMTTRDSVIIVLIVLALALVGIFAATGRVKGFLLYPQSDATMTDSQEVAQATQVIGSWVLLFGILGCMAVGITACGATNGQVTGGPFWQMVGNDILVALAAGAVGGLFGFLFGIPRTIDPATGAVAVAAKQAAQAAQAAVAGQGNAASINAVQDNATPATPQNRRAQLAANTNLERISDWLTTLLLGATLAQSGAVLEWLKASGTKLGVVQPADGTLVPLVIVYFLVLGFLGIYLITRLYLTVALGGTLGSLTGSLPPAPASAQPAALSLSAPTLPDGQADQPYPQATLQATGGTPPLRWSVNPALPADMGLDTAAGTITGTPRAATPSASYTFTVTDSATPPQTASATATLTIGA